MWFIKFLTSSIGKKIVMAVTGLCLVCFLLVHAAGNTTIFVGSEVFQAYADTLHSHPVIVFFFRIGLLSLFLIHIGVGLTLWMEGRREGKNRYEVNTWVSKNAFAMSTMPYTGLFLLLFILIHVFGFAVAPGHDDHISAVVDKALSNFFYALFYLVAFVALFIHLSHGFWSMLQTFGINHPRYNTLIGYATYALPGFFMAFFSLITVYLLFSSSY
ncbi:MAG: succinate dehydrogenase [Desulfobacterales bacterium]|nr:MAG: succinate dehydrogenase [Desulfobacterales bacterium]